MDGSPDVLVVGAGPAGSIAALVLARAGVTVRIVDRSDFPRDKLCGDTLNPGALSILDRLGVGDVVRRRARSISGMTVTGPGNANVSASYPPGLAGAAILRRDLDSLLLDAATAAGADFTPGVRVRAPLATDGRVIGIVTAARSRAEDWRARVVIAADGRRSTLAFALGLARFAAAPQRWAFGTYFDGVDGMTSRGEMHIRADGYVGVAPLPGGLTNVCVVHALFRLKAEATNNVAAGFNGKADANANVASGFSRKILSAAIAADPDLRDRFARARQVARVTALGPLAVDAGASGVPGLLLAGDAAGFVDPMTGDGLRFALRGGELAARAALDELQTGASACGALHEARAREFGGKWRVNRALRVLVGSPRGVSLAASVAARWAAPVQYLVGVAGDINLAK